MFRSSQRLCSACSHRLLSVFINDSINSASISQYRGKFLQQSYFNRRSTPIARTLASHNALRASVLDNSTKGDDQAEKAALLEAIGRQARQTFGETLPENFLSEEEYVVYERLYGPPSATTLPEDVDLLIGDVDGEVNEGAGSDDGAGVPSNTLLREDEHGNLEEVRFEDEVQDYLKENGQMEQSEKIEEESAFGEELDRLEEVKDVEGLKEDVDQQLTEEEILANLNISQGQEESEEDNELSPTDRAMMDEFQIRIDILREQNATLKAQQLPRQVEAQGDIQLSKEVTEQLSKVPQEQEEDDEEFEEDLEEEIDDELDEYDSDIEAARSHPLTKAGRFGTLPSTLQLPKDSLLDPTKVLFAEASNKHIKEVTLKTFGGKGLPNSTATIRRPNLKQATIPLEASRSRMTDMEANAFLAAIYPGAYASAMSVLVEVRKRLGSAWLRNLMAQPGGPRILDAGSGGAAVLAWREVIKAEHKLLHPESPSALENLPYGKSTVVTGSHPLRHRAAELLENTTFIPRLPDYDSTRDHPSLESSNPQPRKQYDIIIAPYTLWSLKEDYNRKAQIQNFWSLLAPRGGVLIIIEKGVPRGFELIAGAREALLQHHISSPGAERVIDDVHPNRFTHKETGMIIAPCTNHGKCPMYIAAGKSQGRKDFCRFKQRFIRPPYLQRILGENEINHEDVSFSYVAFQRGKDLRKDESFAQGTSAADAAFAGFEDVDPNPSTNDNIASEISPTREPPHPLTLPRAILSPIKRHGHVILDLCTPGGKIERWTVPKSLSKQAYKDARKSKWGDLWALGGKTRVARNIRVGMLKRGEDAEERPRDWMEDGLEDGAVVKRVKRSGVKGKAEARERKGRSGRDKYPKRKKDSVMAPE